MIARALGRRRQVLQSPLRRRQPLRRPRSDRLHPLGVRSRRARTRGRLEANQDDAGFRAPHGLTTAERRHPQFRTHGTGTCEWDGAVWPFATSQTLTGLANVLRGPPQAFVTRRDYFDELTKYARSHQQDGKPYLGEYLDETTGEWLITGPKAERSRFYNHSTFNDLVISGLVGLVPRDDDTIEVDPLLPARRLGLVLPRRRPLPRPHAHHRLGPRRRTLPPRRRPRHLRRRQGSCPKT